MVTNKEQKDMKAIVRLGNIVSEEDKVKGNKSLAMFQQRKIRKSLKGEHMFENKKKADG